MSETFIRDTIYISIEVSKRSNVPLLLVGNPGIAKTTLVQEYAKNNGYFLYELIPSHYTKEDVCGFYKATDDNHIKHLSAEWYDIVMASKKPVLLFIDELTQIDDYMQGAMLDLIFSRRLSPDKKLPENCLVIAGCNYADNLPPQFQLSAPMMNRFMIVNVQAKSNESFFNEFLKRKEERNAPVPKFNTQRITSADIEQIRTKLQAMMIDICNAFTLDGKTSVLNVNNQKLNYFGNVIFDGMPLYNFISGRTISYLWDILVVSYELNIHIDFPRIFAKFIEGLIGAGTGTFDSEDVYKNYNKKVVSRIQTLLEEVKTKTNAKTKTVKMEGAVHEVIQQFLLNQEKTNYEESSDTLVALYNYVEKDYAASASKMQDVLANVGNTFMNDLMAINNLNVRLQKVENPDLSLIIEKFNDIDQNWSGYRNMLIKHVAA